MTEAQYKDENKFKTMDGAFELCIREEFTLRSFQKQEDKLVREKEKEIDIPTKIWFLDTETAIYNQFEQKEKTKKGKKKQAKEDSDDE